jgi:hypothetical protein
MKQGRSIRAINLESVWRNGPNTLPIPDRGHWGIENRGHYVRDVTVDEDRSPVRTDNGPQLMACLRNFTIGVLRVVNKAINIASELRKLASKPHLPLQLLGL